MPKNKIKVKKIRTEKDIDNLKKKDVVEIEGYVLMRYDRKLDGQMVFLGRFNEKDFNAIIGVGFGRDQLFPSYSGIIGDRAEECWEHYYWSGKGALTNPRLYNYRNKKLLEAGL